MRASYQLALVVLLLFPCSVFSQGGDWLVSQPYHIYADDTVTLNLPQIRLSNKDAQEKINQALSVHTILANPLDEDSITGYSFGTGFQSMNFRTAYSKLSVVCLNVHLVYKAVYPIEYTLHFVFDTTTGNHLTMDSIIDPIYQLKIEEVGEQRLRLRIENGLIHFWYPDSNFIELYNNTMSNVPFGSRSFKEFTLTDEGISCFHPFDIAESAKFLQPDNEIKFSYKELKQYLRPQYLDLFVSKATQQQPAWLYTQDYEIYHHDSTVTVHLPQVILADKKVEQKVNQQIGFDSIMGEPIEFFQIEELAYSDQSYSDLDFEVGYMHGPLIEFIIQANYQSTGFNRFFLIDTVAGIKLTVNDLIGPSNVPKLLKLCGKKYKFQAKEYLHYLKKNSLAKNEMSKGYLKYPRFSKRSLSTFKVSESGIIFYNGHSIPAPYNEVFISHKQLQLYYVAQYARVLCSE